MTTSWSPMLSTPYDARRLASAKDIFVSEKLDGVRAAWDGRRLLTRNGAVIPAPERFLARLPAPPEGCMYDGELFAGRGNFKTVISAVKNRRHQNDWSAITYKIFDTFFCNGNSEKQQPPPFAEVFEAMRRTVPAEFLLPHFRVKTVDDIAPLFERLVAAGAEGLMVRRGDVGRVAGRRTGVIMKMKASDDAEAVVIGHVPGKIGTKYEDRVGALRCRWWRADDDDASEDTAAVEFNVGSGMTDAQRAPDGAPAIGEVVIVRFASIDARTGRPRHPVLVSRN